MGQEPGFKIRGNVFVVEPGFLLRDKTVGDVAVFSLEPEEGEEIFPYLFLRHLFHGEFDEGVVVPYPDFVIPGAGIEACPDQLAGKGFNLGCYGIGQDFLRKFLP